jgi:chromosome segregation ATPase
MFTPKAMNYSDAIKWAKEEAKKAGKTTVYVGESVNEAATVKDEAIERLSDFFRVSPNALKKFNFDGKDNIKELTKVLNSTSDHGTEMYYKVAIDLAKKDLGESVSEGQELIFDIVEPEFNDLKGKLDNLNKKTVDLKWRKALDQIQREVEKLEFFISKYDRQLGAIETNESAINEREYSEDERKSMADKGLALPDGSFPIKDLEDLKNAIQAYGRSKNQSAAAKFIAKRAKELGADDLIPNTDDFKKSLKEIDSAEPFINEAINIKDIGAGSVLNFKDGEVWIVTKVIGNASNPRGYFAKPHDEKTKKANTSVEIELTLDFLKKELESINEAWVGPFLFSNSTSEEDLKKMYDDALSGYANWQKGFEYPKADYKKAYQEIEKILKKRGIKVGESLEEAISVDASYVHQITGCGQDAAQNFIDDNKIDGKKLADYVKQHRDSKVTERLIWKTFAPVDLDLAEILLNQYKFDAAHKIENPTSEYEKRLAYKVKAGYLV